MNTRTKSILKASLNEFACTTKNKQKNMVHHVQKSLKVHTNGLNSIGMGLDEDRVQASKIFLRTLKN